jgi:acetolactate synthase-1/2/3 large subunit
MKTVSNFIVKKLEGWKIKDVFIFQGGAISQVLSEIGSSKKIKFYCPYHEQALAMAVDGYARINGLGVGFVTSGPGATNLLTGVASSYYDSIPCIFFTGQVGQFHLKRDRKVRQRGYQETDVVSIFKSVTKFVYQLKNPNDIDYILDKAFFMATSGRPGPVVIDIPFNIQKAIIKKNQLKIYRPKKNIFNNKKSKVDKLTKLLNRSKKPLLIAGGGVRLSKQEKEFIKFSSKKNLPFVTTWPAQDLGNFDNPLFFGSLGRHSHMSANILSKEADLIITFGVRFSPKILINFFAKKAKVISLDIDKHELNQGLFNPNLKICCNIKDFFNSKNSIKKIKIFNNVSWNKYCAYQKINYFKNFINYKKNKIQNKFVNPYKFILEFSNYVKNKDIFVTDTGCNLTYFMQTFKLKNNQRIISAWGNSPMGYSVAAGLGAKIANKKNSVYSLIGDGAFLLNIQELQFIKFNKILLKIIVFDNKIYGNTKIGCEQWKLNNIGNDLSSGYLSPDVKKLTEAFNIDYMYLDNNLMQKKIIKKFIRSKKSCVLHLNIHPDHPLIEHK